MSHDLADFRLRDATREDVPHVLRLIRELAHYERAPEAVVATEEDLARDGFGAEPRFRVVLAERAGEVVGFAFYFFAYSTWEGRPVLYLEDLFVEPAHRKLGIGLALMKRLARVAVDAGCTRFHWQVLDWNAPAIAFYGRLGARILGDWRSVRVDGESLRALATP
jgi:GNAT superfamily N-acetyltransferase